MKNLIFSLKNVLREKQAKVNADNDFCTIELKIQGYNCIIAIQKFKNIIKMRYTVNFDFCDVIFCENYKKLKKEILNIINNPYLIFNLKNSGILSNKKQIKNNIFVKL